MLVAEMPDSEFPQWLDKADAGTIGVLTLDDGECMTAQVVGFDDERDELVVDVIPPETILWERCSAWSRYSGQPHCFLPAPAARCAIVAILRPLRGEVLVCTYCIDGDSVPLHDGW
jgi:hypothetical protein